MNAHRDAEDAPVVHDFSADLRDLAEDARRARVRALLSPPPAPATSA